MTPEARILLKPLALNLQLPKRGSEHAAGWDLHLTADILLEPYKTYMAPTEISAAIPEGTAMLILPRSGLSTKEDLFIPNSPGLIDSDYRGHWYVGLRWQPNPAFQLELDEDGYSLCWAKDFLKPLKAGSRIAQALLIEYIGQAWRFVDELPETKRGTGGFGSTGTHSGEPSSGAV